MWTKLGKNRTFGMEIEFADADKSQILIPDGYTWTDNDLTCMHNSDGSPVTHGGQYGGELNTRPLKYTKKDLGELQAVIRSIEEAGGYLIWNEGFDSHLYIGDLPLETIKRIFELGYWIAPHVKKLLDMPPWFENKYMAPTPTYDYVEKVNWVETIEAIPEIFTNGSQRGHIRFWLNIVPIVRLGTVEFRILNSSWDFEETDETIRFMYSFVDYAITHEDASEYRKLDSCPKVAEALNIDYAKIPKHHHPLLWASEEWNNVTPKGERMKKPRSVLGKLREIAKGSKEVHLVNSYFGDIEQALGPDVKVVLWDKALTMSLFYRVVQDDLRLEIGYPFEWCEMGEGTKAERLAKLMLFELVRKCTNVKVTNLFMNEVNLRDFQTKWTEYVRRDAEKAARIIPRLQHVEFRYGDVLDATDHVRGTDSLLIYQNEFCAPFQASDNEFRRLGMDWPIKATPYKDLSLEGVRYAVVAYNACLGLPKVLRDGQHYVYSSVDIPTAHKVRSRVLRPVLYPKLPDDYEITAETKLRFMPALLTEVDYLRMMYMKKDIILGACPFSYMWFMDEYLIGACLLDFFTGGNASTAWMKSDFVIDSAQKKLSKALIMGTLSTEFKEEMDIRFRSNVTVVTTTVFSNKPVSMKYRGVFKLTKRDGGKLYYDGEAGRFGSLDQTIREFVKRRG